MFSTLSIWLKRLLVLVAFLVLLVFFVNFTSVNTQLVSLDLVGMILPEISLSTLVMVPFVLGGLVGLLVSSLVVARLVYSNKSLGRKLARRDNEIQKLRSNALKGLTDA